MFYFTTREEALALKRQGKVVVDVSFRAFPPYFYLSPFYPHGSIPVPGMEGIFADSVEGVWQGLKIIKGKIAPTLFKGEGRKRWGKPIGHRHGEHIVNYRQARELIYVPTYTWMVYYAPLAREAALRLLKEGSKKEVFLYDVEKNPDPGNLESPLAHAAVLADILNENLRTWQRYQGDPRFRKRYDRDENGEPRHVLADILIKEGKMRT